MPFPHHRPRRLRQSEPLRRLVRETRFSPDCLISPIFVCEGKGIRREIPSMPAVFQLSEDQAVKEAKTVSELGIPAVILFGVPDPIRKEPTGSQAWHEHGIVQQALRSIKKQVPGLLLI